MIRYSRSLGHFILCTALVISSVITVMIFTEIGIVPCRMFTNKVRSICIVEDLKPDLGAKATPCMDGNIVEDILTGKCIQIQVAYIQQDKWDTGVLHLKKDAYEVYQTASVKVFI